MKTITLKMPPNGNGPDQWAGERGEHRTYRVIVPLPRAPAGEIQSVIALFTLDNKPPVVSPLILPGTDGDMYIDGKTVSIVLWSQVTNCRTLRIQLVCYGDPEGQTFVDNSPVSERIMFQRSLAGSLDDLDEISDNPGIIAQLIAWMHRHPNKPVLDAFTADEAGVLHWNGDALAKDADLQAEAATRGNEDEELWEAMPVPLTNSEIDDLVNQAIAAIN